MRTLYTLTSGLHSEAAGKPSEERFILTQWGAVPSTAWFAIAFVIFFSTFFSYFLVPFGQKYLQPTTVAMYNYLQPVTASLIAVAANHHNPVVCLAESCRVSLENILVVSWLFKAESAIAGDDE